VVVFYSVKVRDIIHRGVYVYYEALIGFYRTTCSKKLQVSGVSPAAGRKSSQFDLIINSGSAEFILSYLYDREIALTTFKGGS
jgi:hypothetical protein